jgi:glyoxylase-like metal-dependent hydrolase (beta-lactamase superfamily II)
MRIHHLNCIASGASRGRIGAFALHCLLVETHEGLLLVDTGLGLGDVADPQQRLSDAYLSALKPGLDPEMTALRQIERMGFRSSDVRDIVLTHLDCDQAGGLDDFPRARVHVLAAERDHAIAQKSWLDRQRYRPQQWSTQNRWMAHEPSFGAGWMGFECARDLPCLPTDLLLVPLPGHTPGHAGVALRCEGKWLLHAGDAFFDPRELDAKPQTRLALRLYERFLDSDHAARVATQQRLRDLHRTHPQIEIFCTHDIGAFERLSGRTADERVPAAHEAWRDKIVRRPVVEAPISAHHGVPGLEVADYTGDADTPPPRVPMFGDRDARPRR